MTVQSTIEKVLVETDNNSVRRVCGEVMQLLADGVSDVDIFVLSDDRWTQDETAMSRQDIESEDTWPGWPAPANAEGIAVTLADWIRYNTP